MQRKTLMLQAIHEAMAIRQTYNFGFLKPVNIFDLVVDEFDIELTFSDIPSMEGAYKKGPPARIVISSLRPVGRQAFTCAHELGHHVFGHGSTLDEIEQNNSNQAEEFLVDSFASALLMPKSLVNSAFTRRGWQTSNPQPLQLYIVAGWLGVGYTTLAHQMCHTLHLINGLQMKVLLKTTPKDIRKSLGFDTHGLTLLDASWKDSSCNSISRTQVKRK